MRTIITKLPRLERAFLIRHCFFLFLVTCYVTSFAKDPNGKSHLPNPYAFKVTGKISDDKGNPLAGATIMEKGSSNATSSLVDGSFSITIQKQSAVLVISYVGFVVKEVSVNSSTSSLTIQLSTGVNTLEDVIIVGYGTQKRGVSTVAVSSVKGEQLAAVPAANISNELAGRVTGVLTRANGGRPGADNATIYVRGIATTAGANGNPGTNTPLIVVDGIPRNNINEVDPNNIANVTILKDAAAVAPYGLSGANGVILITTKRGTVGAPILSVSGYYGDQTPTYVPKMLGALDYMRLKNEAVQGDNPTIPVINPTYSQSYIDNYLQNHATDPDKYPISDALNDVIQKHAPIYQGSMQIRGGTRDVKYFAGIGYFNQKGCLINQTITDTTIT